jgi:hypothetical protein
MDLGRDFGGIASAGLPGGAGARAAGPCAGTAAVVDVAAGGAANAG